MTYTPNFDLQLSPKTEQLKASIPYELQSKDTSSICLLEVDTNASAKLCRGLVVFFHCGNAITLEAGKLSNKSMFHCIFEVELNRQSASESTTPFDITAPWQ